MQEICNWSECGARLCACSKAQNHILKVFAGLLQCLDRNHDYFCVSIYFVTHEIHYLCQNTG